MKIYRFQKFLIFQIYTLTHWKFFWGKSFGFKKISENLAQIIILLKVLNFLTYCFKFLKIPQIFRSAV